MTKLSNRMKVFLILLIVGISVLGISACVKTDHTYTVTFTVDGEEYAKLSADWDKPITFPAAPQKKGYTFDGWYDGDTKVSEINQGYKDAVTLTAKWKIIEYVITYELSGGTNNEANPTSYTVENENISLAQPQKYGYAFKGWFYGENQVDEIDADWNCDVTLTAKWQIDTDSTCFTFGENYTVTGLKDESVKDILIPDHVTAIDGFSFLMTSVKSLRFAEGSKCKSIGEYAFEYCEELLTVEIPASIEEIGMCAFYMCTSLQTIDFAENSKLERITNGTLNDCFELKGLTLPASIVEIEDGAIAACSSLEQITFAPGSKLERIGDYNFVHCNALNSIVIPQSVTYIGTASEYTLSEIYYVGNASDWSAIDGATNFAGDATIYYYSASQPTQAGNYWHYNGQSVVKW